MKKTASILSKTAYVITAVVLLVLTVCAARYTFSFDLGNFSAGDIYETPDSIVKNLLFAVIMVIALWLGKKILFIGAADDGARRKRSFIFSVAVTLAIFVFLVIWVSQTLTPPYADQKRCINYARAFLSGDYSGMADLYLITVPHQYDLIFAEEPFFLFFKDYSGFQYMNAFFISMAVFLSSCLSREIFKKPEVDFYTTVLCAFFIPNYYYVTHIYGDMFLLFAAPLLILMVLKWRKSRKFFYLPLILVLAVIMYLVKNNALILLLSVGIFLIIDFFNYRGIGKLILCVLLIVLPILSHKGVILFYDLESGNIIGQGAPNLDWVVMGTHGDPVEGNGVGLFDGSPGERWTAYGFDNAAAIAADKEELKETFEYYRLDKEMFFKFYRFKLLEQWVEPTFSSILMTNASSQAGTALAEKAYNPGLLSNIFGKFDKYLFTVYLMSLLALINMIRKDREYENLMIYVYMLGVLLFSLVWEAGSRYSIPGVYIILIPAAYEFERVQELTGRLFYRFRPKKENVKSEGTSKLC